MHIQHHNWQTINIEKTLYLALEYFNTKINIKIMIRIMYKLDYYIIIILICMKIYGSIIQRHVKNLNIYIMALDANEELNKINKINKWNLDQP